MTLTNQPPKCDNVSAAHEPFIIGEDESAERIVCKHCKHQEVLRKDHRGIHEPREYARVFKQHTLQGNSNLFYKYYPHYLRT